MFFVHRALPVFVLATWLGLGFADGPASAAAQETINFASSSTPMSIHDDKHATYGTMFACGVRRCCTRASSRKRSRCSGSCTLKRLTAKRSPDASDVAL